MTFRVAVISEDHTRDEYIFRPVVERLLSDIGLAARVEPAKARIQGWQNALAAATWSKIQKTHFKTNLFLFLIDRDCDPHRQRKLDVAMERARKSLPNRIVLGSLAIEELEVWALAPHHDALGKDWSLVRKECDVKRVYFEPFVARQGWSAEPGRGRQAAMARLRDRWDSVKARCPELQALAEQIRKALKT